MIKPNTSLTIFIKALQKVAKKKGFKKKLERKGMEAFFFDVYSVTPADFKSYLNALQSQDQYFHIYIEFDIQQYLLWSIFQDECCGGHDFYIGFFGAVVILGGVSLLVFM